MVADTAKVTITMTHICEVTYGHSIDTKIDDLELLKGHILLEFRHISHISQAITDKRMKIDPYCQRRNCSPLNVLFSDV